MKTTRNHRLISATTSGLVSLALLVSACGSADSDSSAATDATTDSASSVVDEASTVAPDTAVVTADTAAATADTATADTAAATSGGTAAGSSCEEVAALFVTKGSANADLADPEVSASCDGDSIVITSNGIPDYTYIETSPGSPAAGNYTFTIPATPTKADTVTDVPDLGTAAIALDGVPIYGPTEGTGGDVLSLVGALSACGSHNGPTGFHIHQVLTSADTDCLFTPEEVAAGPQLIGYAFDGYPIYTGIDQHTSSWELTDESLFATDTWAAHSYVEGLGDLDQCNGITDADGNYAYYTTATFPYVIGCYAGVVDLTAAGAGGGGGGGQ